MGLLSSVGPALAKTVPIPQNGVSMSRSHWSRGFLFFFAKCFSLFCCSVLVVPHVVLHRVSIRTLSEPLVALCRLGSEGEVDAASFRSASFRAQPRAQSSGSGVVATFRYDLLPQAAT